MLRDKAPSFADRLPPVVPKQETDISHLSDEMAEILYPGWRRPPFRMEVVFDAFEGEACERALGIARRSPRYREEQTTGGLRHHASFELRSSLLLRDLFEVVGQLPGTDLLVNGKAVPYARELWLPLFWLYPGRGE